ncbi:Uncharacterised protein [Pseudomonas fluorescens]|uniref:Uncharacterized protein n=1 Tax=Pseudomonas fluorescens TaxID=294 RepID=A0A3S4R7M9_PSEFL|nr:hypothetical protein [Pseudomonas fluorescens]VEF11901.1 Uncharacterised protein [Pseudomonas fluorescens]
MNDKLPAAESQKCGANLNDSKAGKGVNNGSPNVPPIPNDQAPIEVDTTEVEACTSVATQRQASERPSRIDDPDVDPKMNDLVEGDKEHRGVPSDNPESGA